MSMIMTRSEFFDLSADHMSKFEYDAKADAFSWTSKPMERMFGYGSGELVGNPVEIIVPLAKRAMHKAHRAAYEKTPEPRQMGRSMTVDLDGQRKDGTTFPVEVVLIPHYYNKRLIIAGFIMDMTGRARVK